MADPVAPIAVADTATTVIRKPVAVAVLANDTPGTDADELAVPLDDAVVTFALTGQPEGVTGDATALEAAAGTWEVVDQTVVFTPAVGFTGVAPAVKYVVTDAQPLESNAVTVTVTVTAPTDLSSKRTKLTDPKVFHSGSGRAKDVTLTANITEGEVIDPKPLGLNGITAAWVLVPVAGSPQAPQVGAVALGKTVRFIGY